MLITAGSLSGCQHNAKEHYRVVQQHLKESYQNGDITREEYEESLDRYRKAQKTETSGVQAPENSFSF